MDLIVANMSNKRSVMSMYRVCLSLLLLLFVCHHLIREGANIDRPIARSFRDFADAQERGRPFGNILEQ